MIKEHDSVVLTEDIPSAGLESGDIGVVVHVYPEGKAYEVEFLTLDAETYTVETLTCTQVRAIHARELPHVRQLPLAA